MLHSELVLATSPSSVSIPVVVAQVRPIMVTGDSAQCAHYIGRACGMIEEAADLLLADMDATGSVAWSLVGSHAQDIKLQTKMSTAQASGADLVFAIANQQITSFGDPKAA